MKWFVSEKELKRDTRRNTTKGIILGSVLGGLAAFFLTPMKGKEAREKVAQSTKNISRQASTLVKENVDKLSEKANSLLHKMQNEEEADRRGSGVVEANQEAQERDQASENETTTPRG